MRILVFIHEYPPVGGGGGQVARDLCRTLASRGHEIKVVTGHIRGLPFRDNADGFEIIRLPTGRRQPFVATPASMIRYTLAAARAGIKLLRSWRPDILHAHFAVPAGPAAWAISRLGKVPYVLTAHLGDIPGGSPEKTDQWFRWVYPFTPPIWRSAAAVSAVSEFTRQLALARYKVKIRVIQSGVDLGETDPASIHINTPPVIAFAGRFVPQKNPLQVVRTLAQLRDLPWRCIMLGDGPLRAAVETEIESEGLGDRFLLPGWVKPEAVVDAFRRSDILLMPSRVEGLPVVGLQAMAMGLAIVASRVGGFVELVEHGTNGYLVEPDSLHEAAPLLRKLLTDENELAAFRKASRRLAGRFSLGAMVSAYEELFRSITAMGLDRNPR